MPYFEHLAPKNAYPQKIAAKIGIPPKNNELEKSPPGHPHPLPKY